MGFFSSDMEPMIDIYQYETVELIEELNKYLMESEKSGMLETDVIHGIFRVVHTIKSSSAMMGMDDMSICTHRLEDLFQLFRNDESLLAGNEARVYDLMYVYADYIKDEIDRVKDEEFEPSVPTLLMEKIDTELLFFRGDRMQEKTWKIIFSESCQMENVRAFMMIRQIKEFCDRWYSIPADLEKEGCAAILRKEGLILHVVSNQVTKVYDVLAGSIYVSSVEELLSEKMDEGVSEKSEQKTDKNTPDYQTSKFGSIPWEKVVSLQKITGELITSHAILENALERIGNPRELEEFSLMYQRLLGELEELVTSTSLMPISGIVPQLYRIVRDICRNEGKEVDFQIKGEEIEVEKNLMDTISNSLIHLIRNAIDHGIENPDERTAKGKDPKGIVRFWAESIGGTFVFRIADDGKGLDYEQILTSAREKKLLVKNESEYTKKEILDFILMPGFSTVDQANEYSGRGVGMDVVRNTVDMLGGVLEVNGEKDCGTEFVLKVPVSMTSVDSIRFLSGEITCLIPTKNVERIYSINDVMQSISMVDGRELFQDSTILPVVHLRELFEQEKDVREQHMLIVQGLTSSICLMVGEIMGQQAVVEKPLPAIFGKSYQNSTGIIGCAIIGDGGLGMMINAERLIRCYQKGLEKDARARHYK